MVPYLNKLEPPSPKGAWCWLKLAQWFWREDFKIFDNVFLLFRYFLSLEKGLALHLKKQIPFSQGCFVPSLVKIGPVVLEKKMKM